MECSDFGKFTLLNHMGKGGVASVYRANDNEAGNIVAIKIFEPGEKRSADTIRRLRDREVQMLISIQHPNVVKYYESGNVDESYYYTMEFVENSLLERIRGPEEIELVDKIHILRQSCNALQAIHHQGIVHRDIKPGNILLDEDPSGAIHVKVTDLGIAKHVSETDAPRDKSQSKVPGTPKYLSPEQIRLKSVDGRADIFSLGIVAYEMLTGATPFKADTSEEYLRANLDDTAAPIHHVNDDIPAFLNPMIERMLAKGREERYDSDTLARDLELTYQHLVSKAPLVERRNPESVYYVPPVSEGPSEEKTEEGGSWWRYPAAGAMALLTVLVVFLQWPETPEADPGGDPPDPQRVRLGSAGEVLADAEQLVNEGRYWEARGMLATLAVETLNQSQVNKLDTLERKVQEKLGQSAYEMGMKRLEKGALPQARMLAKQLETLYPKSGLGEQLESKIAELKREIASQKKWKRAYRKLQNLSDEGKWTELVENAENLMQKTQVEDRKKILRNLIIASAQDWQRKLLQSDPSETAVHQFLDLAEELNKYDWFKNSVTIYRADLELKIARAYKRTDQMEAAMEQAKHVIKTYPDTHAAREARRLQNNIIQNGLLGPMDLAAFSEEIQKNGFKGPIWKKTIPEDGHQSIEKGILVLKVNNEAGTVKNARRTMRPVRPGIEFTLSVQFRADSRNMGEGAQYLVGMKVEDRNGKAITVNFDGEQYSLIQRRGDSSGGSQLHKAFGDEGEKWHELTILYQYDIARVKVMIDGKLMGERDLELGVFQTELFVTMKGEGAAQAAFRNLQCE